MNISIFNLEWISVVTKSHINTRYIMRRPADIRRENITEQFIQPLSPPVVERIVNRLVSFIPLLWRYWPSFPAKLSKVLGHHHCKLISNHLKPFKNVVPQFMVESRHI